MTRRPPAAPWQLRKAATAKALRALPVCEECRIKPGMGFMLSGLWLCVRCAAFHVVEQRAQRERIAK